MFLVRLEGWKDPGEQREKQSRQGCRSSDGQGGRRGLSECACLRTEGQGWTEENNQGRVCGVGETIKRMKWGVREAISLSCKVPAL